MVGVGVGVGVGVAVAVGVGVAVAVAVAVVVGVGVVVGGWYLMTAAAPKTNQPCPHCHTGRLGRGSKLRTGYTLTRCTALPATWHATKDPIASTETEAA